MQQILYDNINMSFIQIVDELIEKANNPELTRKSIAEAAGIAIGSFGSMKSRKNYPKADVAVRIAKALGTSVEYLVTGEDDTDPWLREHSAFIRDCKELDVPQMTGLAANAHVLAEANRRSRIPANAHTSA